MNFYNDNVMRPLTEKECHRRWFITFGKYPLRNSCAFKCWVVGTLSSATLFNSPLEALDAYSQASFKHNHHQFKIRKIVQ